MPSRVDANHGEIVQALRALGWTVKSTATMRDGFPDLLVARRGVLKQVEVKDGSKPPSKRALTPDEARYHAELSAAGCPVVILASVADVQQLR